MIKQIFIILVSTIMLTVYANATTYYVANNGNDSNGGSSGSPFRTIQKGVDAAAPGDTVYVRRGVYYEQITPSRSGSSGSPITIKGESGAIVDGTSAEFTSGWSSAGSGKYSRSFSSFTIGNLYVQDGSATYYVPRCVNHCISGTATNANASVLNVSSSYQTSNTNASVPVDWWDGIEATYYQSGSTLYVRFRDNDNPNNKTIRVSSGTTSSVFDFNNDSYITLDNLEIRGAARGVRIRGNSNHIVVQNCSIYACARKVYFDQNTGGYCTIDNNTLYSSEYGSYGFGPWSWNNSGTYTQGVYNNKYDVYKLDLSDSSDSSDESGGVNFLFCSGGANNISNNTISGQSTGVGTLGAPVINTYGNTITNSQQAVIYGPGDSNHNSPGAIYNNLLIDANISIRLSRVDTHNKSVNIYIYNNKAYNQLDGGDFIYYHIGSCGSTPYPPHVYIYHNSIAGIRNFMGFTACTNGDTSLSNHRIVDNIISTRAFGSYRNAYIEDGFAPVDFMAYNWSRNSIVSSWNTGNNIISGSYMWDNSSLPNFEVPEGSAAHESGIDVSSNFIIDGKVYASLPGMESGYYAAKQPDLGIVTSIQQTTANPSQDPAPPNPPQNLRIASQ